MPKAYLFPLQIGAPAAYITFRISKPNLTRPTDIGKSEFCVFSRIRKPQIESEKSPIFAAGLPILFSKQFPYFVYTMTLTLCNCFKGIVPRD